MEFLLTYGWAIVIAVLVVTALFYYGIPQAGMAYLVPASCTIDTGIYCMDHSVSVYNVPFVGDRNRIDMQVKNVFGFRITILSVDIPEYGIVNKVLLPAVTLDNDESTIDRGTPVQIPAALGSSVLADGERYDITLNLDVRNDETGLLHNFQTRIMGKVGD